jgi:hypothetical protein
MYVVQSVILKRDKFTRHKAFDWIYDHEYKADKVDMTPEYYRFRQHDPSQLHHGRFKTIKIGEDGYLVMFYSGKKDDSK